MLEVNALAEPSSGSGLSFCVIHYKMKEDHRYVTKVAYVVLGITIDGHKGTLGMWIGKHESSNFLLNVVNDLKSRGGWMCFWSVSTVCAG